MYYSGFNLFPQATDYHCRSLFMPYLPDDIGQKYDYERRYPYPYEFAFEHLYALVAEKAEANFFN